ncbi:fliW family protein [[Clostridium] bifermentans ATCC 638]|uniref:Flagellar assembly factor FliW n=1 Tax=Paraclostridium bifermentans ATCC 638 = DSM 14991 TaxID=1233171 RepID=T4VSI5_PARBF|nr:flagellar assembly protein FliW [Paraclostridium bifermentans]EQK43637.1 fliW family protein [[Clostridium] bifermentans ATCC 638] [Paraclostridium bifermentans ATCC 638 = DSM 14991]RIZ59658.1 flagellar assembly protein FliW [Paraclostridium bifermentans]UAG17480.1 flagellar assembly protein FliW [Paraclostridium bifermentans]
MELTFKKGLPGFELLLSFELENLENNEKFKILKSKEEDISFVTTSPFEIYKDYEINLNDETIKELQIENPEDVLVLTIITLGKTLQESTINLKAPIIINIKSNLGRQYILQTDKYETKHPLIRSEQNASSN